MKKKIMSMTAASLITIIYSSTCFSDTASTSIFNSSSNVIAGESKPFYINNNVFTHSSMNKLIEAFYRHAFNNQKAKVLDVQKISENYLSAFILDKGQYFIIFTDGDRFFHGDKSPVKYINSEIENKMLKIYLKNVKFQSVAATPYKELKTSLLERLKAFNHVTTPIIKESVKPKGANVPLTNKLGVFLQKNYKKLTPVFLGDIDSKSPDVIVFISDHCGYCKRLIHQYKNNEEIYKGINFAFIPIGKFDKKSWTNFFGGDEGDLSLTAKQLNNNNEFMLKMLKTIGETNVSTPTYLWLSKQKNEVIEHKGIIELKDVHTLKKDASNIKFE